MKVLFLDMDGVLNSDPYLLDNGTEMTPTGRQLTWPHGHIDPKNVEILNRILLTSGASVVLSSSWRRLINLEDLTKVLRTRGYKGPDLMDLTPTARDLPGWQPFTPRRKEIQVWLDGHPEVDHYVILDDDPDAEIKGHYIQTDCMTGLVEDQVEEALRILKKKVYR